MDVHFLRFVAPVIVVFALSGCTTTSTTTAVGPATVTTDAVTGELSGPLGGVGVGAGAATLSVPSDSEPQFGRWTLARAGDAVCSVELGGPNAVGDNRARTRNCKSVELARIALWMPQPDGGLVLYDFERRAVVTLRKVDDDLFEGRLWDGVKVTLWR